MYAQQIVVRMFVFGDKVIDILMKSRESSREIMIDLDVWGSWNLCVIVLFFCFGLCLSIGYLVDFWL